MADFDLTQTDAQVQSILNDGQNMQGAGAQTTLTTESVLLKDVNGNYHKILKSSFTEAIRDTLAGLLVNNDKGTTINQIAAIASGDFGSITPANLASVLGVKVFTDNNQTRICTFSPDKALYLGRYTVRNYTTITFSITSSVTGLTDSEQVATTIVYATKREPSVNAILRVDKVNQTFELYYTNINDNTIDVFVASKRGTGVSVGLLLVGFSTVSDRATADVKALTLATTEGV